MNINDEYYKKIEEKVSMINDALQEILYICEIDIFGKKEKTSNSINLSIEEIHNKVYEVSYILVDILVELDQKKLMEKLDD